MSFGRAFRVDFRAAALLFSGAMCLLPFLQPRHMPPLRAFYSEWLALALGTAAMALIAMTPAKRPLLAPAAAICLAAFSLALFLRALVVESAYPQSSLLWGLYALFAALAVVLGCELATQCGRDQACEVIAAFFVFGALANAVAGAFQVFGIPFQPILMGSQGQQIANARQQFERVNRLAQEIIRSGFQSLILHQPSRVLRNQSDKN